MRIALALAACAALLTTAAEARAASPDWAKLILQPKQVGKGYVLKLRADGFGLAQRTLDLCGVSNYPSEKLRTARLQVDYLRRNTQLGISNEVVTYKRGGAAEALREVVRHATTCPRHAIVPGEQNLPPLRFRITRLTHSHLLKGYVAVRVRVTGTVKGKHVDQISYAVYQRLGNVFSGVYSFAAVNGDPAGQEQLCMHAAEQSARNLRRAAGTKPQGPTA